MRDAAPQGGALDVDLVGQIGGNCHTVAAQGDYVYIGVGPRLLILDVSDPAHPQQVSQTAVLPGMVRDVTVAGGTAYVADGRAACR